METAGFTKLATTLGLRSLIDKALLSATEMHDEMDGTPYTGYRPSRDGLRWLFANKDRLTLKTAPPAKAESSNEDIPF